MNEKAVFGASLLAGLIASLCCIGPLVFAALGLGAFALSQTFEALRPAFLGLTGALLAVGFYFVYRKPRASCEGEVCTMPSYQKWGRPTLWVVTVLAVGLALFPLWYGRIPAAASAPPRSHVALATATVELKVDGMTCEVCARGVKKRLMDEPGVQSVEVSLKEAKARVIYDSNRTAPRLLVQAVNTMGFRASL